MTPLDYSPLGEKGGGGVAAVQLGGASGGAAGYPPPPSGAGGSALLLPPDYFPPIGATDFFIQGTQAGAVAPSGNLQLGLDVQLPPSAHGVIRDVNLGISAMTAATVCTWLVLINGTPAVGGWGALTIAPRGAAYVSSSFLPESTCIRLPTGALLQFFVNLSVGGPCDLSGSLHGWFWS